LQGGIQIVCEPSLAKGLSTGSFVEVHGLTVEAPAQHTDTVEVQADQVLLIGACDPDVYPLAKKRHSFEFLRELPHLRARTNTLGAVMRVRDSTAHVLQDYLRSHDFFQIHTPVLTATDAEGAGEVFQVGIEGEKASERERFFGEKAYLNVSGQLEAEIFASALGRVYTFGPTFRADPSDTRHHLAEFWMLEPEFIGADLPSLMNLSEDLIKLCAENMMKRCSGEFKLFSQFVDKTLGSRLTSIASDTPFRRITYHEAVDGLTHLHQGRPDLFKIVPQIGNDLAREHERYLCEEYFGFETPVFVTDYPRSVKPFYMRVNKDEKTVSCMDLLVPGIGEVAGGSVREERLSVLVENMKRCHVPQSKLQWYLDLRQFGSAPHGGFGIGFERLIQLLTGMENIRDVIPVPRHKNRVSVPKCLQ